MAKRDGWGSWVEQARADLRRDPRCLVRTLEVARAAGTLEQRSEAEAALLERFARLPWTTRWNLQRRARRLLPGDLPLRRGTAAYDEALRVRILYLMREEGA